MTTEAASAPLTKNRLTRMMTRNEVTRADRELLERREQRDLGLGRGLDEVGLAGELQVERGAAEDREPDEAHARWATRITPSRYSRIVRPREMRARKVPTNGAQEIHHAQ